jgi:phosphohistidine phosphatase SixA
MKNIIIARDGEEYHYKLTKRGEIQTKALGELLKEYVNGGNAILFSSTAPWVLQSARILEEILNIKVEKYPILWSGSQKGTDLIKATELIKARCEFETIIVMTHLEYVKYWPRYLAHKFFEKIDLKSFEIPKGHAWLLDCEEQRLKHLRPQILRPVR